MPYCEAAVLEGVRMFMGHTFGIPHRALRDTKFRGYHIPKVWTNMCFHRTLYFVSNWSFFFLQDTMLIACFYGMSFDKTIWPDTDPELSCFKFNPARFIKDGKITIPERHFPFGVGKHRCMGELMARANIFLFTTTLLQNFNFQVPPGHPVPTDEPVDGATASIQQYTALVINR